MSDLDQIAPAGGFYVPSPPVAQVTNRAKELEEMNKSLPVIEDVLAWFDKLIAATDSIDSINLNTRQSPESQILAMQILKKQALVEQRKFKTKFKNYLKATE